MTESTEPRIPVPESANFGTPHSDWTAAFPPWVGGAWARVRRAAGMPRHSEGSLKLDPVLQELCRLMNAKTQNCVF